MCLRYPKSNCQFQHQAIKKYIPKLVSIALYYKYYIIWVFDTLLLTNIHKSYNYEIRLRQSLKK